jgi:putative transposase
MSERMKAGMVCDALTMAYQQRRPDAGLIMHIDRGSQYASKKYRTLITQFCHDPINESQSQLLGYSVKYPLELRSGLTRAGIGHCALALTCRSVALFPEYFRAQG